MVPSMALGQRCRKPGSRVRGERRWLAIGDWCLKVMEGAVAPHSLNTVPVSHCGRGFASSAAGVPVMFAPSNSCASLSAQFIQLDVCRLGPDTDVPIEIRWSRFNCCRDIAQPERPPRALAQHVNRQYAEVIFGARDAHLAFAKLHQLRAGVDFFPISAAKRRELAMQIDRHAGVGQSLQHDLCRCYLPLRDAYISVNVRSQSFIPVKTRRRQALYQHRLDTGGIQRAEDRFNSLSLNHGQNRIPFVMAAKFGGRRSVFQMRVTHTPPCQSSRHPRPTIAE